MLPTTERMTSTPEPVEPSRMLVVLHTYQDILHLPGLQSCIQFSGRWLFGRSAVSRGIAHAPESTVGERVGSGALHAGVWIVAYGSRHEHYQQQYSRRNRF